MITRNNLKEFLIFLGYEEAEENYSYHFEESNCDILIDFSNEKIIYPTDNGMIVNEKQTTNFSSNENFVVLECIHRLLKKGYKPSHIEIEKRWSLGHLQKSGRADICVMNATGNDMLFIIECKTYGNEFEKELNTLKTDGGQLFSYLQQEKSTKWLMLYASTFNKGKLQHQVKTIPVFDTEDTLNKAKKDKTISLYENSNSKDQTFDTWVKTYGQKIYGDLIFSEDTIAYNIGEKPLRKRDLKEFNPRDKIVNKFEEILRHNNVSDKENAFNKLTALFICKLVDEINKDEDNIVEFQYKFGTDTYETLLDRLQRLYKEGMDKFMKEEIFYVSSEYPLNLFSTYRGQNRKNAIEDLRETFRKLKFYSNSDFAFKDVHNEELFQQNGKILVEVVKLFENYRIVYSSKHQFLGDLFEQLLNQGFKQNEGQFFTPIPITRFIWESLPINNLKSLSNTQGYPKIIDYACGSGHFLTEGIDLINQMKGNENNDWIAENIYGIEKDYRLARVSKISLFMNGAGSGNIIFGDGLDNHKANGIENNSFDILVANPPYSVKAFKSHLDLKENEFELTQFISNEGSEIEVLFVERITQLLKPNGIAAVILPSSILSNTSNSYVGARDEILRNFKIKAISQFADKTFGATGTNTVILFLQKYNEPPKYFKIIEDTVQAVFNNEKTDEWMDNEILEDYLEHIGVGKDLYIDFIEESINYTDLLENSYFKMYVDDFENSTELKNLKARTTFKKLSISEQKENINNLFYRNIKEVEKEKLFYFALVREQETVVVKSPTTATGQYDFLGYQWSNRKGSEGIQIKNLGGKLYNPKDSNSDEHIAPIIRNAFNDDTVEINDSLEEFINIIQTRDMLDFEREKFDKSISLIKKEVIKIESKYDIKKIKDIIGLNIIRGVTYPKEKQSLNVTSKVILTADNITLNNILDIKKEIYIEDDYELAAEKQLLRNDIFICFSSGSLKHIGKVAFIYDNLNKYAGGFMGIIRLSSMEEILPKYLFLVLSSNKIEQQIKSLALGGNIKNISSDFKNIKIPVPPIDLQEKIISECEKIEEKYETIRMKIEEYRAQIQKIFEDLEVIKNDGGGYKLSDTNVFSLSIGKRVLQNELTEKGIPVYSANVFEPMGNTDKSLIQSFDTDYIVWGIDGDWMVNIFEKGYKFYPTDHCGYMTVDKSKINPRYMAYILEKEGKTAGFSRSHRASIDRVKNLTVNVPNINKQNEEMEKVYVLENKIKNLKEEQIDINLEISKVLESHLK
ncbi:MAG: N-6 DNA methylase [Tissierellia bacterium]|nr:N-6 DNA methylase [Tissierellia bacterium]